MKANELRIGNIVYNPTSKKQRTIDCLDIRDLFEGRLWRPFEPIALTPEWLLSLGFKNSESINKSNSFFYKPVGGSELHINPDNGVVWIERYTNIFNNPALIKYVHQLQNLYFCLCGEELQLTTQQQPDNTTPDS